jgi:hypothetical protein
LARSGFRTSSRFVIVFILTNMPDACLFFKPFRSGHPRLGAVPGYKMAIMTLMIDVK